MPATQLVVSAADFLPRIRTISALEKAARNCKGCHLYKCATQTVFGQGSDHAELMVVGEIAGEKEDEVGTPFVGPAGKLLRKAIVATYADLEDIYFTNVVKHFKFTYMNKRKLHRSPGAKEIKACRPWLDAEISAIQPKAILCLGAIAAKTIVSKDFHLREERGKWFRLGNNIQALVTFHPSAILRTRDKNERHEMKAIWVRDIKKVINYLAYPRHSQQPG